MNTKKFILFSLLNSYDFKIKIEAVIRPFSLQRFILYFDSVIENNEPKIKCKILWITPRSINDDRWTNLKDFSTFDELLNNLMEAIEENNNLINNK